MKIPYPPKKMNSGNSDKGHEGEFISYLFGCSMQVHVYHLCTKGAGAYAMHMALGGLYDALPDMVDSLAESIQGKYGILKYDYSHTVDSNVGNALTYVKKCLSYVETERKTICQESYVQNQIDEIVALFYSTIYKLENLQ
jgi:DNA-binding ferritin-like protein